MKPAHAYLRTQACFCCESWSTEGLLSKDLAPLASFKREINASVITNATEKAMMRSPVDADSKHAAFREAQELCVSYLKMLRWGLVKMVMCIYQEECIDIHAAAANTTKTSFCEAGIAVSVP